MEPISLNQVVLACAGTFCGASDFLTKEIQDVTIDSRKIKVGDLFIPLKGERVDGHSFIPEVMQAGALCCLSEHVLENALFPYILVASCQQALQDLAAFYRKTLDITVIGITGSVGKTGTKEMIASVLQQEYRVLKTEGNYNNEIGLPLTIFKINKSHRIAVLEMGIDHFDEMHRLAEMAQPNMCVITNIGYAHIENLGSREGILKAKTEMFDHLSSPGLILLNGDDDLLQTVTNVQGREPVFYGLSAAFPAYAENSVSLGLQGTLCTMHLDEWCLPVTIPLPGAHHVYNALAGAYLGKLLGLTKAQITAGIAAVRPLDGRSNIIQTKKYTILDDCYNANPISMKSALDTLTHATGRRVAIMGDMFELGTDEKALHKEVGSYAAELGTELILCIGQLAANIAQGAQENANSVTVCHYTDKEKALEALPNLLQTGDTILIKASHGMAFPEFVQFLTNSEDSL